MGQWLREWGGEAERAPEGFMRVLTAPFCSDIPGLWDSSKTLHVAKAGQDIHFRDLVPVISSSKGKKPCSGGGWKLCIGCAVSSHLSPKSQGNYRVGARPDQGCRGVGAILKIQGDLHTHRDSSVLSASINHPRGLHPSFMQLSLP